MRSAFLKKQRAIRAFTLHELVIALAVIAILAAVIIPAFLSVLESARASAALETCRQALLQFKIVLTPHNRSTDDFIFRCSDYSFLCRDGSLSRVHISIDGDRISFEPSRTAQPCGNMWAEFGGTGNGYVVRNGVDMKIDVVDSFPICGNEIVVKEVQPLKAEFLIRLIPSPPSTECNAEQSEKAFAPTSSKEEGNLSNAFHRVVPFSF